MQASEYRGSARRAAARGFTMAELMAVVAIVGILALIATVGYRKYVAHAKTAEVMTMFSAIKIAEEAYKDETFQYLGPSPDLTSASSFYPDNSAPGKQKMNFAGAGTGATAWQQLGVQAAGPVLFVYACTAGANSAPTALGSDITVSNWPSTVAAPWYVVKARADIQGNGVSTVFATASFTGDLFSAND